MTNSCINIALSTAILWMLMDLKKVDRNTTYMMTLLIYIAGLLIRFIIHIAIGE